MIRLKYWPLVIKQITRHRVRSVLTILGVAIAMYLFVAIQAMQQGVAQTTEATAADTTLVVYREDRFCPFTSQLPEYYLQQIEAIDGVVSAVPIRVVVNNCRASLDVVTFRGVPRDLFESTIGQNIRFSAGTLGDWQKRSDAALLGETLAARRGLKVGDQFDAAGITVYVAGILESDEPQDQNVAYVHLDFLQQQVDRRLGTVTQFNVKVDDPERLGAVSNEIDELFASAEQPTSTRSEKAFVAQIASDMIELIGFTRYLGWGCLVAVLALVGNAIVLSVQDRIKEHAVLQTLGYPSALIGRLIVTEAAVLGLLGGLLGASAAMLTIRLTHLSFSVDGLSIPIEAGPVLLALGMALSIALGVAAGLVPAVQAARRPIASCFRAV
ncbi:MAG: ABC transporter permease [Phycisphaeraceae bacterium]|nr:ABC transporter permease [Phycisphaeraceae bacterium]